MSKSRFVVQDSKILSAFILGPLAGLSALWFCLIAYDILQQQFALFRELLVLPWLFMFGLPICLLAEAIVVAPLLFGFSRYQWRWLNGWSAGAIGAASGALFWLVCHKFFPKPPEYTPHLWTDEIIPLFGCVVVGLVSALVFRAIAVKTVEPAELVQTSSNTP